MASESATKERSGIGKHREPDDARKERDRIVMDFVQSTDNQPSGFLWALTGATMEDSVSVDADGWILPTSRENLYEKREQLAVATVMAEKEQPLVDWVHAVVGKLAVRGRPGGARRLHYVAEYIEVPKTCKSEHVHNTSHGCFWWLEPDACLHKPPNKWRSRVGDRWLCVHSPIDMATFGVFSEEWDC